MDTIDLFIAALGEIAVGHHSVLGTVVLIVDRDNHGVVVLDALGELESDQIVDIKLDLSWLNLLFEAGIHCQVLDIILPVGCVEHLRGIVRVFLFSDTHVDANMSVAESIVFESDIEFLILCHLCLNRIFMH